MHLKLEYNPLNHMHVYDQEIKLYQMLLFQQLIILNQKIHNKILHLKIGKNQPQLLNKLHKIQKILLHKLVELHIQNQLIHKWLILVLMQFLLFFKQLVTSLLKQPLIKHILTYALNDKCFLFINRFVSFFLFYFSNVIRFTCISIYLFGIDFI